MKKKFLFVLCIVFLALSLGACSSKEAKRDRFYKKGMELYEKALYVKAGLEFKNSLQLDPKYQDGWYMMGMIEEKQGDLKKAFGYFSKATTLNPDHIKSNLELGKIFLVAKMPDKAMEKAELVLKKVPNNDDALLLKAGIFIQGNKGDEGAAILRGLLAKKITKPEVYLMLFNNAIRNKDIESGGKILAEGIAANPKSLDLYMTVSDFYMRTGRLADAESAVKKMIQLEPKKAIYKLNLASLYMDTQRKEEGRNLIKAILNSDPGNEDNRLLVSMFYQQRNMLTDVETTLKDGIAQNKKSVKLPLALSELYTFVGKIDMAIAPLNAYLAVDEDKGSKNAIKVKNALAMCYIKKGEPDTAQKYVDEALKVSPKDVNLHYTKGQIYLIREDGLNAVAELRPVVNEMPQFIQGHIALAEAHRLNGEMGLAIDTLKSAQKVNSGSVDISLALAKAYINKNDYENAIKVLREIIESNPKLIEAHGFLGDVLVSRNDMAGAEKEYREILNKNKNSLLGYAKLAQLYAKNAQWEKAITTAEQGYSLNPESPQAFSMLAGLYISQNKMEKARKLCEDRLQKNAGDPQVLNLLGRIFLINKDYSRAGEYAQKAIQSQPGWVEPYSLLTHIYLAQGKKDEIIKKYQESISKTPQNPALYFSLGALFEKTKEYDKARNIYELGLQKFPDLWPMANNLAFLLAENPKSKTDLDRALAWAKKAQSLKGDDAAVNDTLGWVLYRSGDMKKALKSIGKAFEQDPLNPIYNFHLGMIFYKNGELSKAEERLEAALKSPDGFVGKEEAQRTLKSIKG
jgi:FimV-like protein